MRAVEILHVRERLVKRRDDALHPAPGRTDEDRARDLDRIRRPVMEEDAPSAGQEHPVLARWISAGRK